MAVFSTFKEAYEHWEDFGGAMINMGHNYMVDSVDLIEEIPDVSAKETTEKAMKDGGLDAEIIKKHMDDWN